MRDFGFTAKFMGSNHFQEEVFNGVFYNLDAQIEQEFQYENAEELYQFFEVVGEGAFSIVHRAIFMPSGEEMAVKIIKDERTTSNVIQLVKQEAELLNRLDHPNVVKVKHLIQLNGKFYMGMDYSPGGSLQAYIKTTAAKLSDKEASQLMKGILQGVSYIHK